jgi:hypothetical protein
VVSARDKQNLFVEGPVRGVVAIEMIGNPGPVREVSQALGDRDAEDWPEESIL